MQVAALLSLIHTVVTFALRFHHFIHRLSVNIFREVSKVSAENKSFSNVASSVFFSFQTVAAGQAKSLSLFCISLTLSSAQRPPADREMFYVLVHTIIPFNCECLIQCRWCMKFYVYILLLTFFFCRCVIWLIFLPQFLCCRCKMCFSSFFQLPGALCLFASSVFSHFETFILLT